MSRAPRGPQPLFFRVTHSLAWHPRVEMLAGAAGISFEEALGWFVRVWACAVENPDGGRIRTLWLRRLEADFRRLHGREAIVAALLGSGVIREVDGNPHNVVVHGWQKYAGVEAERRRRTGERLRRRRDAGWVSPSKRFAVLQRCGFMCVYCGAAPPDVRLEIDHILPVALGGTSAEHNLTAACERCNAGKTDTPIERAP